MGVMIVIQIKMVMVVCGGKMKVMSLWLNGSEMAGV